MVVSTAPSPHRDCPTEILDGDVVPPLPPSHAEAVVSPSLPSLIGAAVSSPSASARAPATLPRPFLSSKNKGHASKNKGHVSADEVDAAATLCSLVPMTQDPHQGYSGEKQRLAKKRLRSPLLVPIVGSPGVNVVLSQASPRLGVKRSSPTLPQIPRLSHKRKRRKLKSEIWNDYDPVYDGNKIKEAHCKYCKRVFICTRIAGTSQCIRHLLVCEERAKVNEFIDSVKSAMPQPDPNSVEKWKYDPDRAHWELMRMIVVHELPFSIVEYDGFRRFVHSLNPTFEVVSRTTITLDCLLLFDEQRTKLREAMQNLTSRVSLTADMWTSSQLKSRG
uniref:BED-type domain-containing protein n=1 Tax=Triticum urartu TaxID=4572 RepID=A0A8R7Q3G3_TRIUA